MTLSLALLVGCAQLTTNDEEESAMRGSAMSAGDMYVDCMKASAMTNVQQGLIDVASAISLAGKNCQSELETYKQAQKKYLKSQVMMTDKPLAESVDALNERVASEVAEALLAAAPAVTAPVVTSAAPAAAVGVAAAATPAAVPASATRPASGWTAQQRIYLDCMADAAVKYAELAESSAAIAEVAHSRCSSYMTSANAALQQEGRAVAMGAVMDARLKGPARNLPQN